MAAVGARRSPVSVICHFIETGGITPPSFSKGETKLKSNEIPLSERFMLTIKEAANYFGIGEKTLKKISGDANCTLWVGSKRMIKRRALERYLETAYSI